MVWRKVCFWLTVTVGAFDVGRQAHSRFSLVGVLRYFEPRKSETRFPWNPITIHSLPFDQNDMNRISSQLAKQQSKLFRIFYAPVYKTFILNHIVSDPSHPLQEAQKRLSRERKKEGLWWHVTTGVDLNKSSCVRSWTRRRLRTAIVEELKARGFDENGKLIHAKTSPSGNQPAQVVVPENSIDLKGGLRVHAQAAAIPAKYADIKTDIGQMIDILAEAVGIENNGVVSNKTTASQKPKKPPAGVPSKKRKLPRQ
jgi:hypothetical protein